MVLGPHWTGFDCICSIDTSMESIYNCEKRFHKNYRVDLIHGNTIDELPKLLMYFLIVEITFWLDAHNENDYPVLAELEVIKQHSIKTHIILIDDLRMFHTDKNGLTLDQIKAKILEINPNYKFSFENGHVKDDILVAKV